MNKALFLDRDGVINEDKAYVYKIEDFIFNKDIFPLCKKFAEDGYFIIIITNQAGIARGFYTEDDYNKLNGWMLTEFEKKGVRITKSYHCPYHPKEGIGEYMAESDDRKPNPGMILKAVKEFNIDVAQSMLIGDKDSDIEAGRNAGINNLILLEGRYKYTEREYLKVVKSLKELM